MAKPSLLSVKQPKEIFTCLSIMRSSGPSSYLIAFAIIITFLSADTAFCQEVPKVPKQVVTLDDVRLAVRPATDIVAGPIFLLARMWSYIVANTSAAILLSALLGALFTSIAIINQKSTTRLRETFSTINDDNWDKDVISSREIFGTIKNEIEKNTGSITKYCHSLQEKKTKSASKKRTNKRAKNDKAKDRSSPDNGDKKLSKHDTFMRKKVALETIMNDYENLALGIRYNIVDEVFLYRWMRGSLLDDWDVLSPMVTEFRHILKRPETYIEFEGLASSWARNRSYRTGRKLKKARRRISIR